MLSETKLMVGQILQDRNRAETFLTDVMETELSGFGMFIKKTPCWMCSERPAQ